MYSVIVLVTCGSSKDNGRALPTKKVPHSVRRDIVEKSRLSQSGAFDSMSILCSITQHHVVNFETRQIMTAVLDTNAAIKENG